MSKETENGTFDVEIVEAQRSIAEQAKRQADEYTKANQRRLDEERNRQAEAKRQFEYCTRRDALNAAVNFMGRQQKLDAMNVITCAEAFLTWMMMQEKLN